MIKSLGLGGVLLVVLLAGCAKQPVSSGGTSSAPAPDGARMEGAGTAGGGSFGAGGSGAGALSGAQRPAISDFVAAPDLTNVHFDFDRADIREADAKLLDGHAGWLKSHAGHFVLIEGHCDERGTHEYNTALGDRRARATMNYLVSRGVAASRIALISYGEERPLCSQHDDACWAKNRRAHFMVKAR